jgi:nucleoside-diphosphate-sugar epimerase
MAVGADGPEHQQAQGGDDENEGKEAWADPCPTPLPPSTHHRAGKRIAETLAMDYNREHGTEVRIIRIFNTYGPRMALDDGRVVSNFVAQALTGALVWGEGEGLL